jgi:hypothetical protein
VSNRPKRHDSGQVYGFLSGYFSAHEMCQDYPAIDDILSGVLELQSEGSTSTRSLSRQVLFHILQTCPLIDVESVNEATHRRYSYRSLAAYAATARTASKAIQGFLAKLPPFALRLSVVEARRLTDSPYLLNLLRLGLIEAAPIFAT